MDTQPFEYRPGPSVNRERRSHLAIAQHLKENPGVWALVRTTSSPSASATAAYQIRQGVRAAFRPAGHYDAYAQGNEVVARYTGGKDK